MTQSHTKIVPRFASLRWQLLLASAAGGLALSAPAAAQEYDEINAEAFKSRPYSPYAKRAFPTRSFR